jgi:hypothetical protein
MQNRPIKLTALLFLILPTGYQVFAHPGSLDLNGGHYMGNSYHCHLTPCEIPDTFSRGSYDSIFNDRTDREIFFNEDDWNFEQDFDGDCQSTRQEMLILTSRTTVSYTNPRNCVVRTGEWYDEYTGKSFTVATQLELDHIIPRLYAHTHGGDQWTPGQKLAFSNDPMNLLLVERREVRRKRDDGPDRYMPPREEYHCQYVRTWEALAEKYDLQLETRDRNKIIRVLRDCPELPE